LSAFHSDLKFGSEHQIERCKRTSWDFHLAKRSCISVCRCRDRGVGDASCVLRRGARPPSLALLKAGAAEGAHFPDADAGGSTMALGLPLLPTCMRT
jgi:hypothetical protein